MEEEKAAAYYDELTRKGEGAAKFKQGLGFSATSGSSNDAVPSRGSALISSSSFLSSFVRASSPSKTTEFEKQAQLKSIQNKLKKKPKDGQYNEDNILSSRASRGSKSRSRSPSRQRHLHRRSRSPSRNSRRRSRSRGKERQRSRSRSRDSYRSKRSDRSRSRDRGRGRGRDRYRSVSPRDRRSGKVQKDRAAMVDYSKLVEGYEKMTPAERVKAKMKLQLSETARKDETKCMGSGWERFDFNKDAPLDDEEIEAVEDDAALVDHIGKSFRFSALETRREEQLKAAHDEAMFGAPSLRTPPPLTVTHDEAVEDNGKEEISEIAPATSLISGQALAMQQGSWRDRARRL